MFRIRWRLPPGPCAATIASSTRERRSLSLRALQAGFGAATRLRVHARQHAGDARMPYGVLVAACQRPQLPPRRGVHRLHARSRGRGQDVISTASSPRYWRRSSAQKGSPGCHRLRSRGPGPAERLGRPYYEALIAEGDEACAANSRRVTSGDAIALELYLGHDWRSCKGVVLPSPGAKCRSPRARILMRRRPASGLSLTLPMFHCNGWCFPGRSA